VCGREKAKSQKPKAKSQKPKPKPETKPNVIKKNNDKFIFKS